MNQFDTSEAAPLNRRDLKNASVEIRRGFVRKVYSLLSCQLLLTFVVACYIYQGGQNREWLQSHEWMLWVSVAATFGTICVMVCCQNVCRTYPTNYIFLFAFTFFEAIMIGFVSATFTPQGLLLAAGATVGIFGLLTVYAFYAQTDFTGFGPYVFCALAALCVFGGLLLILPVFGIDLALLTVIYDALGVLVFSFFIIFDTQLMLGQWGGHKQGFSIDDYVFASLNLYMDIINMFIYLLSLLGERQN